MTNRRAAVAAMVCAALLCLSGPSAAAPLLTAQAIGDVGEYEFTPDVFQAAISDCIRLNENLRQLMPLTGYLYDKPIDRPALVADAVTLTHEVCGDALELGAWLGLAATPTESRRLAEWRFAVECAGQVVAAACAASNGLEALQILNWTLVYLWSHIAEARLDSVTGLLALYAVLSCPMMEAASGGD